MIPMFKMMDPLQIPTNKVKTMKLILLPKICDLQKKKKK